VRKSNTVSWAEGEVVFIQNPSAANRDRSGVAYVAPPTPAPTYTPIPRPQAPNRRNSIDHLPSRPQAHRPVPRPQNNSQAHNNINLVDANGWFLAMKGKTAYPLFPQTGIHFSFYGAALFADSIISHVEQALGKDLPDFSWTPIEMAKEPREEDDDLEDALNIIGNIPSYELPYPTIVIDEEGKYKPRSLTIGDSFYWRFVNWGGLEKVWKNGQFWYYNKDAHPSNRQVANLDFGKEIEKAEVICILMASVNLWRFGFGFDDQLYDYYFGNREDLRMVGAEETAVAATTKQPADFDALVVRKIKEARSNEEWFAYIQKRAKEEGVDVETALRKEAVYIVKVELGMLDD